MRCGIDVAKSAGITVEYRSLVNRFVAEDGCKESASPILAHGKSRSEQGGASA